MATAVGMCSRMLRNLYRLNGVSVNRTISTRNHKFFSNSAADTDSSATKKEPTGDQPSEETNEKHSEIEETFKKEIEALQTNVNDLKDKYQRSIAETENVRQRMKKQVDDTKLFGIQGFCKDLLEVADILGKANESVPKELVEDKNPHLKSLFEGLTMTEGQLHKVFNRHGLFQIKPEEGEQFDPDVHEALFQREVPGKEGNTVATVTKIGYRLHTRTIRPALVGVYK